MKKKQKSHKKNNFKSFGLWLLLLVVMIASIVGVYFLFKDKKEGTQKEDNEILFDEKTLPRVDASLATQPLMDAFLQNFTGKSREDLHVTYTNTHPGYVKLINGETDLLIVTEPSAEELKLASEKNVELEVTKVVNEGFVFFVNQKNPVDSVTLEEVQKIYTGEITNWKELGGSDNKIIAFQRPENSGSQTGLLNLVMKGKKVKVPTTTEQVETMAGIIDVVSDYDNGIQAIGYSYYYYANTMYMNDYLKYLAIDGVKPTAETIQNGTYPLITAYYIVTRKGETNENVQKLKDAMLSNRGQEVAQAAGYVKIK